MNSSRKKKFSLSESDFKDFIDVNYYFVDKSMFIHDVIEDENKKL